MAKKGPDFIGIGPPRTASTWIFECLGEHPQIKTPYTKEPYLVIKNNWDQKEIEWYESLFKNTPPDKLTGEYSTQYLADEKIPGKIASRYPNVKLICNLRNPIDRAFSHYLLTRRIHNHRESFEQKIADNYENILTTGNYATHLKRYWQYFNQNQILIMFYDDLTKNPIKFIQSIYEFLGLNHYFIPTRIDRKINSSRISKYKTLDKFLIKLRKSLTYNGFGGVINFLDEIGIREMLAGLSTQKTGADKLLNSKTRMWLKNYYRNEIKEMESIFNRDLSHWQ